MFSIAQRNQTRDVADPRACARSPFPSGSPCSTRSASTATHGDRGRRGHRASPTTCSFHFRQLAKYGFVEEAGGAGRRRPWRLAHVGLHFTDVHDDPATATAATALDGVIRERRIGRMRAGMEARARNPREWQEVTGARPVPAPRHA